MIVKKAYHQSELIGIHGHMFKTKKQIGEDIKLIDIVIEILDSRIPIASQNPDIAELTKGKKKICNKKIQKWIKQYRGAAVLLGLGVLTLIIYGSFAAYTSFEEQMKGSNAVMSAFTAEIGKLFQMALQTEKIEGVILNPWNRTLMLNKNLIHIVVGTEQ